MPDKWKGKVWEWEAIAMRGGLTSGCVIQRTPVPGGWLVVCVVDLEIKGSLGFIPDPDHAWGREDYRCPFQVDGKRCRLFESHEGPCSFT